MRIMLADGRPRVRFALRVLLERQPGLEVVGEASDACQLLTRVGEICPDLVLLGWELPGLKVPESLSSMRGFCPGLSVIALSGRPEARQAALAAGADGFVSKVDSPDRLLAAVDECCPSRYEEKVDRTSRPGPDGELSPGGGLSPHGGL
jgi:two-component system nitrate/nitrite response regulator NarL